MHAGKRKPTSTTTPDQSKQTQTIFSEDNDEVDEDNDDEGDVSALTEGLGKLLEELAGAGNNGGSKDSEDTLAATLRALADQHGDGSRETGSDQPPPDDIFAQLFAAAAGGSTVRDAPSTNKPNGDTFNKGGSSSSDPQLTSFLDSLMHQLLSKEVLYQPMKDIAAKYPQWLADNEDKLSDGDKERYTKQLQCIIELIYIYENDPTNYPVLMDVLQTMQGCGNPPDDIVEELAPGMKFGGDGMGMGGIPSDLSSADCCIQ